MKTVAYDGFTTMRVRYADDSTDDIAIVQDNEKWWTGTWDSYVNNMIKDCLEHELFLESWVSMMIVMTDWDKDGFVLHTFWVVQGEPNITHEIKKINE